MEPRIPTSAVLAQLLNEAPPTGVSLAWLISRLEGRSFGFLILLLALLGLAPGVGTFTGPVLVFCAIQMILGRETPTLPSFLAARSISTPIFLRWVARVIPLFKRLEAVIRPRLKMPAQATKLLVGFIVLLLAATVIWPIPFSHVIPTLIIIIISFVYLEEDGVLLYVALLASLLLFGVTAATVWAILD